MNWESFILGIISNALFWALLFYIIVPKIRFSGKISKIKWEKNSSNKSGWVYRVKLENYGLRNVIDVDFISRLEIKGLLAKKPENWRIFNIPLDSYSQIDYRYPEITPVYRNKRRPIIYIYVNDCPEFSIFPYLPNEIKDRRKSRTLKLEVSVAFFL